MHIICKSPLYPMCLLILLHLTQSALNFSLNSCIRPCSFSSVCIHPTEQALTLPSYCFPPACTPLALLRFRTQIKTVSFYEQPHLSLILGNIPPLFTMTKSLNQESVNCSPQSSEKEDKVLPQPQSLKAPTACFLSPLS